MKLHLTAKGSLAIWGHTVLPAYLPHDITEHTLP